MQTIKAIFFDVDGTLISFNTHKIPQSTLKAARRLKEKGIKLFVATGRHIEAIQGLDELDLDGYVGLNGAYCVDKDKNVLYKQSIPSQDIQGLLTYLEKKKSFPCVFIEDGYASVNEVNDKVLFLYGLLKVQSLPFNSLDYFRSKEIFQTTAFFSPQEEAEIMQHMPNTVGMRWHPDFTDLVARGVSKAAGIQHICEHYRIAQHETMAFGDGGNDIPMLQHVGLSVAMGNAADPVKQAAHYVTAHIDEDGIAKALQHFGLL